MRSRLLPVFISGSLLVSLSAQFENLPPEVQAQLQAQMAAARAGKSVAGASNSQGSAKSVSSASDPAKVRLQLLKKLTIDRTNAGILQARLESTRKAEAAEKEPSDKPTTPPTPAQVELAKVKQEVERFRLNLNLGEWKKAGEYLSTLKENDSQAAYTRILQQLTGTVYVTPRPELAAAGARPHKQKQYLRASDVLSISETNLAITPYNCL